MEETHTGKGVAYFLIHMIGAALYLLLGHTSSTNIVLDTCKANSSSNTVKYSLFSSKEIAYAMSFLWWLFFFFPQEKTVLPGTAKPNHFFFPLTLIPFSKRILQHYKQYTNVGTGRVTRAPTPGCRSLHSWHCCWQPHVPPSAASTPAPPWLMATYTQTAWIHQNSPFPGNSSRRRNFTKISKGKEGSWLNPRLQWLPWSICNSPAPLKQTGTGSLKDLHYQTHVLLCTGWLHAVAADPTATASSVAFPLTRKGWLPSAHQHQRCPEPGGAGGQESPCGTCKALLNDFAEQTASLPSSVTAK